MGSWIRDVICAGRVSRCPPLLRTAVAVDPPADATDVCSIVVTGIAASGTIYILESHVISGATMAWAREILRIHYEHGIDTVTAPEGVAAEYVSNCMDWVNSDMDVCCMAGVKCRDIVVRGYESERIHHVGIHKQLEDAVTHGVLDGTLSGLIEALGLAVSYLTYPEITREQS